MTKPLPARRPFVTFTDLNLILIRGTEKQADDLYLSSRTNPTILPLRVVKDSCILHELLVVVGASLLPLVEEIRRNQAGKVRLTLTIHSETDLGTLRAKSNGSLTSRLIANNITISSVVKFIKNLDK